MSSDKQESSVTADSVSGIVDPSNKESQAKAVVKNVDMTDEMQDEALAIAFTALEKFNIEKDIAANIKKEFDKRFGPTWHVVVGKNFGSYVTHGQFPFFSIMQNGVSLSFSRIGGLRRCSIVA